MHQTNTRSFWEQFKIIFASILVIFFLAWLLSIPFTVIYLLTSITFFSWISSLIYYGFIVLLISGIVWGGYNLTVRRKNISLPDLPDSFKDFKIVQISDLHLGTFRNTGLIEKAVQKILEEKPDIIFFTGDLVNNRASEALPFIDHLKKLNAPFGVFSILGNHDYGDYVSWKSPEEKLENLKNLEDTHRKLGWNLLLNEHAVLNRENDSIAVIGVQNWGHSHGFPKYGDLKKATDNLADTPVKLLLSHDPSHFALIVSKEWKDIDVTFSGHTHGGQFGIETESFKWSPVQYAYPQWAGLYKSGEQHLYVNRGLGMLAYAGRVGIWPEISVITLTKE